MRLERSSAAVMPMKVVFNRELKDSLRAAVDLGIWNLAAVYVEEDSWYLSKGGVLSEWEHYSRRISSIQKQLAFHSQFRGRRLSNLYEERKFFLRHKLNSVVKRIVEELYGKGVAEIRVDTQRTSLYRGEVG